MSAANICTKICKYIAANPEINGIVITDPADLAYVTGLNCQSLSSIDNLCVIAFFSANKRFLACPKILAPAYQNAGWHDSILAYSACTDPEEAAVRISAAFITELFEGTTSSLGFLCDRIRQPIYEKLCSHLPEFTFIDISESFSRIRQIKCGFERQILAEAASHTDHGIAAAMHRVARNESKTEKRLTQSVRIHTMERGMNVQGYRAVSQALCEEAASMLWPNGPYFGIGRDSGFFEGRFIRFEMCGMLNGYWSNDSRMMVKSSMNENQKAFAEKLSELSNFARSLIKPGAVANQVYEKICRRANNLGIILVSEYGLGHGIGVEPVEAPYISAADQTVFEKGMVLVLNLTARYTIAGRELYINKDTIIVNDDGCEVVGRYENWDYPYTAAYTF